MSYQDILQKATDTLQTEEYNKEQFESNLSSFKLLSPDSIEIDGEKLAISTNGQRSLCNLLGIPNRFNKELHHDDKDFWSIVVNKLEELKETNVRFSIGTVKEKKKVYSFVDAQLPWIDNKTFLQMIEHYAANKNVLLDLKDVLISQEKIVGQFIISDKSAPLIEGADDIFKLALDIVNSEINSCKSSGQLGLERMVCSNRAIKKEKSYRISMNLKQSSEDLINNFYEGINKLLFMNISVERYLRERVSQFLNIKASVHEVESAYKIGTNCATMIPTRLADFDELIPLKKICDSYGLQFPIKKQRSEKWKSTASTPIDLYDLFNNLTYIASNAKNLTDEEKMDMQIAIGNTFLGKTPDMLDVAPTINWN